MMGFLGFVYLLIFSRRFLGNLPKSSKELVYCFLARNPWVVI